MSSIASLPVIPVMSSLSTATFLMNLFISVVASIPGEYLSHNRFRPWLISSGSVTRWIVPRAITLRKYVVNSSGCTSSWSIMQNEHDGFAVRHSILGPLSAL